MPGVSRPGASLVESGLECRRMPASEVTARIAELKEKLAEREAQFRLEVLKRGFDPAQIANMALPAALATLAAAAAEIKDELDELVVTDETGENLK
jgi:hypothetical protein